MHLLYIIYIYLIEIIQNLQICYQKFQAMNQKYIYIYIYIYIYNLGKKKTLRTDSKE